MIRLLTLILAATVFAASPVPAAEMLTGKVVSVADGDTLTLLVGRTQVKVRLEGIDAPERGQPFGTKARQALSEEVLGRTVQVEDLGKDRYERTLGIVRLDDRNINLDLVREGWAWWYRQYAPQNKELAAAEAEAQKEQRGLWAAPGPIPPWKWRGQQRTKGRQPQLKVEVVPNGVEIVALLPNPKGEDRGHEQVVIANRNEAAIDLSRWKLQDRARNVFQLAGKVPGRGRLTVTMAEPSMPLNNDGDEVLLIDPKGVVRSQVTYGRYEVRSGQWVKFVGNGPDANRKPKTDQRLDNLDNDAASILRQLPGVAQVTRHGPEGPPSYRIIHLLDWHFVPRDMYAADLRSQSDERITDEEIDRAWEEHSREVAAVQDEQIDVLSGLIEHHGLERVYIEGLTVQDLPIIEAKIAALRRVKAELADLRGLLEEADASTEQLEALEQQFHRDLLQISAPGRLLMDGKIKAVLPLEDAKAYKAADPVAGDGMVVLDQDRIEARQDAQAKRLLDGGEFAVIILGGAHDLSDNLHRLSEGKAEYIRVATKRWLEFAGDIGREEPTRDAW